MRREQDRQIPVEKKTSYFQKELAEQCHADSGLRMRLGSPSLLMRWYYRKIRWVNAAKDH